MRSGDRRRRQTDVRKCGSGSMLVDEEVRSYVLGMDRSIAATGLVRLLAGWTYLGRHSSFLGWISYDAASSGVPLQNLGVSRCILLYRYKAK
jgi:hypothetical protein